MATRTYALDQLTALELDPLTFVETAAAAGYAAVGLHLRALPVPHASRYDLIADAALFDATARKLRDSGLRVHVVEPFELGPDTKRDDLRRNLDLAVRLGAAVAGTLVFDPEARRRAEALGRLAEDATERGLALTIEPYRASSLPTWSDAVAAARAAGPAGGVTLDTLHVVRGGEHWDAVAAVPAELIRTVQLSDGPLAAPPDAPFEAVAERGVPGAGEFALAELLPLLPPGVPIGIEVPSLRLAGAMPALERVRFLRDRVEALFAEAGLAA